MSRITLFWLGLWFMFLLLIAAVGLAYIPRTEVNSNFSYPKTWSNWDGNNYVSIATVGYEKTGLFSYAFFPLYPLFIAVLSPVTQSPFLAGWLLSTLGLIGMVIMLIKLLRLDYDQSIITTTLGHWLLFPSAFFFLATYTESIFLFFLLSAMYWFRQKKWYLSFIFAALACATRITGLGLLVFFAIELWDHRNHLHPRQFLPVLGCALGIGAYGLYLAMVKNDPLFFLSIQKSEFSRTVLVLPFQTLYSYIIHYLDKGSEFFSSWLLRITIFEMLVSFGSFALLVAGWFKKVRHSYLGFAAAAWSLPLSTGVTSSMLRYVLVLFPCFLVLALLTHNRPVLRYSIYLASLVGLACATMYFHTGYWIG